MGDVVDGGAGMSEAAERPDLVEIDALIKFTEKGRYILVAAELRAAVVSLRDETRRLGELAKDAYGKGFVAGANSSEAAEIAALREDVTRLRGVILANWKSWPDLNGSWRGVTHSDAAEIEAAIAATQPGAAR